LPCQPAALRDRKLSSWSLNLAMWALRFFYKVTLGREWAVEHPRYPSQPNPARPPNPKSQATTGAQRMKAHAQHLLETLQYYHAVFTFPDELAPAQGAIGMVHLTTALKAIQTHDGSTNSPRNSSAVVQSHPLSNSSRVLSLAQTYFFPKQSHRKTPGGSLHLTLSGILTPSLSLQPHAPPPDLSRWNPARLVPKLRGRFPRLHGAGKERAGKLDQPLVTIRLFRPLPFAVDKLCVLFRTSPRFEVRPKASV